MNYHIVYNNFKDYAELFIKNIDFSKANINKVLFLHIGDEEAISEIIENTNFKNAEFYIKDEDSIYDIIETLYSEKVHKFLEYNNMEFDLIIANPPYGSLGNPIISEAIKHLTDNGTASVLMPLSCYKKNELYRHVETFELANPKLFADAVITENLCICALRKENVDKYDAYNKLFANVICNCPISLFYKWNIDHNTNLAMCRKDYKPAEFFNQDLDFIDSGRCIAYIKGAGYFTKGTCAYNWNTFGDYSKFDWIHDIGVIHFNTKQAKDNFCKYAYNWSTNKWDCLASKALIYTKCIHVSSEYYFAIPQLDWEHISDTDLWKEGKYDEAVLAEMHLKWNEDKTKIIQA